MNANNDTLREIYELAKRNSHFAKKIISAAADGLEDGLNERLLNVKTERNELAYGFGWLITQAPKVTEREKSRLQNGLKVLFNFFKGTEFADTLKGFLEEENV